MTFVIQTVHTLEIVYESPSIIESIKKNDIYSFNLNLKIAIDMKKCQ